MSSILDLLNDTFPEPTRAEQEQMQRRRQRHAEAVAALDPGLRRKAVAVAKRYVEKHAPDPAHLQGRVDDMLADDALVGHPAHACILFITELALMRTRLRVIDGDPESPRCELPPQRPRRRL